MVLGPTVALIALNLVKLGLFEGLRLDLAAAAEDIMALLRSAPRIERLYPVYQKPCSCPILGWGTRCFLGGRER